MKNLKYSYIFRRIRMYFIGVDIGGTGVQAWDSK